LGISVSNRPFNAKKVKVPLALVEDLCQFLRHGDLHDELMEIIFKAKEPKRQRAVSDSHCFYPGRHAKGCDCRERLPSARRFSRLRGPTGSLVHRTPDS